MPLTDALRRAAAVLSCPTCATGAAGMDGRDDRIGCPSGHFFDVARQGYVGLLSGRGAAVAGDSSAMIAARTRFLASGAYRPIRVDLAAAVAVALGRPQLPSTGVSGDLAPVVEVGCGTGYYLAGVLDRSPDRFGIGLDVSKAAARASARGHPRLAAATADVWGMLPLRDRSVAVLLDVFAPRHPAEWARVLRPGGIVLTVTPNPAHLAELVDELGLVTVEPHKADRLAASLAAGFTPVARSELTYPVTLAADQVIDLVGMGPSAFHRDPVALRRAVGGGARLVTVSVTVGQYRRR